jgi:hypothetical protein
MVTAGISTKSLLITGVIRLLPAQVHGKKKKQITTDNTTLSYSLLLVKSSVTKQEVHNGGKK